jgi:hypothetical protein
MIQANELRIGNLISYTIEDDLDERKKWSEVSEIDAVDILHLTKFKDKNYKPIPLTEEWLLKFGFVKQRHEYIKGDYCLTLITDTTSWLLAENTNVFFYIGTNLDYVHQLQNLYFALTGQELTLNLPT